MNLLVHTVFKEQIQMVQEELNLFTNHLHVIETACEYFRLLTGLKITSEADAMKVMQCLHDKGPKTVVLSSTNLGSEGVLVALASTVKGQKLGQEG